LTEVTYHREVTAVNAGEGLVQSNLRAVDRAEER